MSKSNQVWNEGNTCDFMNEYAYGKGKALNTSRFEAFSQDELHTLATALKETILKIEDKIEDRDLDSVYEYGQICINDAEFLLDEVMEAFGSSGSDVPSGVEYNDPDYCADCAGPCRYCYCLR